MLRFGRRSDVLFRTAAGDTNPKRHRGRQTIPSLTLRVSMGCLIYDTRIAIALSTCRHLLVVKNGRMAKNVEWMRAAMSRAAGMKPAARSGRRAEIDVWRFDRGDE